MKNSLVNKILTNRYYLMKYEKLISQLVAVCEGEHFRFNVYTLKKKKRKKSHAAETRFKLKTLHFYICIE